MLASILVFSLFALPVGCASPSSDSSYEFEHEWVGPIQDLYYPMGIAVDSLDNVYVADTFNDRVRKFTSSGVFVSKWGSRGSGDGQFNGPIAIAVDSLGNVYVADCDNDRVQKLTSSEVVIAHVCRPGSLI